MFSALPLRTSALTSRFTDASRSALDLSRALKYTDGTRTTTESLLLQSPSLLIAYAPAFHGISPSPQSLDISHNALTDEHADILASVIVPHATSIRSLDISGNPGLCVAALAYLIDPLTQLTRFHGSVPATDATPAALAPLLDVAGFAPALSVLALVFPPLPHPQPPAEAAYPEEMHDPEPQAPSRHPPAEKPESSDPQACSPVATSSFPASPPQRFKALQQLCLVNLPAALEDVVLAEFPLSQLRMLDLSSDMHASHAHTFTSAATLKPAPPQPLGTAALATLSEAPTPLPQLKALNLRGRCMHSPHALAGDALHAMLPARAHPGQPTLSTPFQNLPKLARLDGGSVPVFATTEGPAGVTVPGAAEMDCASTSVGRAAGGAAASRVQAQLRALAIVAADAPADLPHTVGLVTALTALEVRRIPCRPSHMRRQAADDAASNADTRGDASADAWGRAVLQLTSLHVLTLAHEVICGEAAARSAAWLAHALASGPTRLASLDLAWHAPEGSPHACMGAHHSDAPVETSRSPRRSLAVGCSDGSGSDGSGERGAGVAPAQHTGFARLVASLGHLSALTSLTLRVPVRIPWQAIKEQVSRLSALQQLALDAGTAAEPDSGAAPALCAAQGSTEVLPSGPCASELDLKGTTQGLTHLRALTAIRLSGVGALRTRGVGAHAESPPGAATRPEHPQICPEHVCEVDAVPAGGAPGCSASFAGATVEHLKAAARKAVECRAHGGDGWDAEGCRFEGPLAPSEGLARVCELALEAGAGVRVDVGEVCGIVAGMPRLQRLEVVTSGDGLVEAEKRRVLESAGAAPLLRGMHLR